MKISAIPGVSLPTGRSYGRLRTWALSDATVASTRLTMLNLLLGHHDKAHEVGDAEGCRHSDVGRVAAAPHDNAADAGMVVTRVHRVPAPIEKHFSPGAEVPGVDIDGNADVAEITGVGELVAVTIAARHQEQQHVVGKVG